MNQTFDVKGMTCSHCVRAVTGAIREIDPAARVEVELPTNTVRIDSELSRSELAGAIREAGYETAN